MSVARKRAVGPTAKPLVDLTEPKPLLSRGGRKYMMAVRDNPHGIRGYFSCAVKMKKQNMFHDISPKSLAVKKKIVRSDCGGEFRDRAFGALSRTEKELNRNSPL